MSEEVKSEDNLLYVVIHNHVMEYTDTKEIGIFTSLDLAKNAVSEYKIMEGFNEQPDNFEIIEVNIYEKENLANLETIYMLEIYYWNDDYEEEENIEYICAFIKKKNAFKYILKHKKQLCKNDRKMKLCKSWLNRNMWEGGFFTVFD